MQRKTSAAPSPEPATPAMDLTEETSLEATDAAGTPTGTSTQAPPEAPLELRRNRDFRILMAGQGISAVGDAISLTALPLLVLLLTGSGVLMGLVGALQTLPDLIFGLPVGALADRWDRRRMMLYADLGRALLTALIPLSVLLGLPTMTVILLVTAPINLLRVFWLAAWTAAVPSLVGREQVGRANGFAEAVFSTGYILGPGIAGVLAGLIGAAPTLGLDAASFLVSAIALGLLRRPLQLRTERPETSIVSEIGEGVRFIMATPSLRAAIAFWGSVSVVVATLVPALIFYLTADRGEPPATVGFVLSAYSVGYLLGALITTRRSNPDIGLFMLAANAMGGVAILAFASAPSVPFMIAAAAVAGIAEAIVLISYITLRSTLPPDELLGRVGSTARMISVGLQPAGILVGGVLLDIVRGSATIGLLGLLLLGTSALFIFSRPLREARLGTAARPPRGATA